MQDAACMPRREKILLAWNGGLLCAVSLFELKSPEYQIEGLISVVLESGNRLPASSVREELLEKQAESLELPLIKVRIGEQASAEEYESRFHEAIRSHAKMKLKGIAFPDLTSNDTKTHRDQMLEKNNLRSVFPLWQWKPDMVIKAFMGLGYKAVVTAVDLKKMPISFVGREFNKSFLSDIPVGLDPCGEAGEFQTFVYDGPFFQRTIQLAAGQIIESAGMGYQELSLKATTKPGDNKKYV